jgi:transcriptional regulator with XRE-family HTH domain
MTRQVKQSDSVNKFVGRRLRFKRELLSLSQSDLGKNIGVSRIKIGQFESGSSAIPASTLYKLAQFMEVDVRYFFEENDNNTLNENIPYMDTDLLLNRDTVSLVKNFNAVQDQEVRKKVVAVMERTAMLISNKK